MPPAWLMRLLEHGWAERLTWGALVITLLGAVLAIGGVHPEVMLALGVTSTVALSGALLLQGDRPGLRRMGPALVMFGLSAWCLVQTVPLPMRLLETIAPTNADIWARSLMPFSEGSPGFAPLSLDPGATRIEALKWFSYGGVFVASATTGRLRGARWGLGLVFGTAVVAALVTLAHGLVGAEKVYGIYTPTFRPQPWHVGPLLNPNNLAGLLNLGALCGLGMLLSDRPVLPRWALGVGVAILMGVDVASASRGGVIMLLVGVVALALIYESRRGWKHTSQRGRIVLGGVVALGAGLAALGGSAAAWRELLDENLEKLGMVEMVKPVVADFPLFGIGRGSFESVFPAYQHEHGFSVYTHAENFVAQWVVEWGIPVAVLALLALGYLLRPRALRVKRSMVAAGAWVGFLVVAVQNLVDLGLEVPGLCFALAGVLGTLWGQAGSEGTMLGPRGTPRRKLARASGIALASGAMLTLLAVTGRHDLTTDRLAVKALLRRWPPPRSAEQNSALRSELHATMARHPAEPYFPLIGALVASEARDENPIPWLQRTLERSLVNGKAHLLLARVLQRYDSHHQALLELRLAVESDRTLVGPASDLALRYTSDVEELAETVPANSDGGKMWAALGARATDRTVGAECDQRALAVEPTLVGPRSRLAGDLIQAAASATGCTTSWDRVSCAARIAAHAAVLETVRPTSSLGARIQARWLAATGSVDEAEKMLAKRCEGVQDYLECAETRMEIAKTLDADRFGAAAGVLRAAACINQTQCALYNTKIADFRALRGEFGNAVVGYERALRDEETDERLLKLANAAARANLNSKAMRALQRLLARRGGHDAAIEQRIADERRRVVKSILAP